MQSEKYEYFHKFVTSSDRNSHSYEDKTSFNCSTAKYAYIYLIDTLNALKHIATSANCTIIVTFALSFVETMITLKAKKSCRTYNKVEGRETFSETLSLRKFYFFHSFFLT